MDTNVRLPSGSEVESATFHAPISCGAPTDVSSKSGIRGKLDDLKDRGISKLHEVQRNVTGKTELVKSNVSRSVAQARTSVRQGTRSSIAQMQESMRTSPGKWIGIAAGAGFGLGMIGRLAQARRSRPMPDLVIIESVC